MIYANKGKQMLKVKLGQAYILIDSSLYNLWTSLHLILIMIYDMLF